MLFDSVKDLIDESQHGFFAGRSNQTNLMDYVSTVAHEIVNGGQVDTIYVESRNLISYQLLFSLSK